MTDFNYKAYLASREWAVLKEQVRERSLGMCEHCFLADYQETHHLTYERIGHERVDDLLAVCSPCHRFLSGKSPVNPVATTPIPIRLLSRSGGRPPCATNHHSRPADYAVGVVAWELFLCRECLCDVAVNIKLIGDRVLELEGA